MAPGVLIGLVAAFYGSLLLGAPPMHQTSSQQVLDSLSAVLRAQGAAPEDAILQPDRLQGIAAAFRQRLNTAVSVAGRDVVPNDAGLRAELASACREPFA